MATDFISLTPQQFEEKWRTVAKVGSPLYHDVMEALFCVPQERITMTKAEYQAFLGNLFPNKEVSDEKWRILRHSLSRGTK